MSEIELFGGPVAEVVPGIVRYENTSTGLSTRIRIWFRNGYGASVVQGPYTYGGSEGLAELGVLDRSGELTYETSVTGDVIGWLDRDGLIAQLKLISELPAALSEEPRNNINELEGN